MSAPSDLTEALAILRPSNARVVASYWSAASCWGVYIFDGGTQLVGTGSAATLESGFAECLAQARAKAAPARAPRSRADLLG